MELCSTGSLRAFALADPFHSRVCVAVEVLAAVVEIRGVVPMNGVERDPEVAIGRVEIRVRAVVPLPVFREAQVGMSDSPAESDGPS